MLRSIASRLARPSVRVLAASPRFLPSVSVAPLSLSRQSIRFNSSAALSVEEQEELDSRPAFVEEAPEEHAVPFASLEGKVHPRTLSALTVKPFSFKNMSIVQARVLSLLPGLVGEVEGTGNNEEGKRDLLVKARTGTGKTLAFLTPAIESRIRHLSESTHPENYAFANCGILILSPTRELATQIANEARQLVSVAEPHGRAPWGVHLFVGGDPAARQLQNWERNRKDILVATPGRLKDFLQTRRVVSNAMSNLETLIFDEADTILDMGFGRDITEIVDALPTSRQTFLFSATVSSKIQAVARQSLKPNSLYLDVVPAGANQTVDKIQQHSTVLDSSADLIPHVMRLLAHDQLIHPDQSKTVVFLPTTKLTQLFSTFIRNLSSHLPSQKTQVFEIHSKLEQRDRFKTSAAFRRASGHSILVTSDVSARGVDYPGTTRVIQVGNSGDREQYTHRVGRTGRGGAEGRGDIVLSPFERNFVHELSQFPVKPLTLDALQNEVIELAGQKSENTRKAVEDIPAAVEQLFTKLSPTAIEDVIGSYLGHVSKCEPLKLSGEDLIAGIQEFGEKGLGLGYAPSFSASFLQKCGIRTGGSSRSSRGGSRGRGGYGGGGFGSRDRDMFSRNSDRGSGGGRGGGGGFGGAFGRGASNRERY